MITKTKKEKTPYLSSMDLERIAFQTIQSFDQSILKYPQPLDVDQFAERFLKLKLDFVDLSNNASVLGMIIFSDSSVPVYDPEQDKPKIIQVDAGTALIDQSLLNCERQSRARFTIAHECAHWLIHKPKGISHPIICRTIGKSDSRDWVEWQADKLASALLMPAVAVHSFMKQYVSENRQSMRFMYELLGKTYVVSKRDQIIRTVANTFGVSKKAAELRLIVLKYIKPKQLSRESESKIPCRNSMSLSLISKDEHEVSTIGMY